MAAPRRFLILRNPIQEGDLHGLLGRIAVDYTSPLDRSVPTDPTPYTEGCLRGVLEEKAVDVWGAAGEGSLIQAALKPFAQITYNEKNKRVYTMSTPLLLTHSLKNHNQVFDRIFDKHAKEIKDLLDTTAIRFSPIPDYLYMVTGYKAVFDATRADITLSTEDAVISVKVPVGAATTVPTGGAVPPGTTVDITTKTNKRDCDVIHGTLAGQTAVAVEYHMYKRSWIERLFTKKGWGTIVDGGVKQFKGGLAMGAGPGAGKEEEEEESNDEALLEIEEVDAGSFKLEEGISDTFWVPCGEDQAMMAEATPLA